MDKDLGFGFIIIAASLGFISYLLFWSRATIDWIHEHRSLSTRDVLKELHETRR